MRDKIMNVLASWTIGYDERDVPRMVDCFTEDAWMDIDIAGLETKGPFVGRDAVIKDMTDHHELEKYITRHVTTNVAIEPQGEDRASVISYLTLFVVDGIETRLHASGVYRDTFVRDDDRWRIKVRRLRLDAHYLPKEYLN
jgi:3-phenylpropionate/cinnamic acid dioxygenase small subunit